MRTISIALALAGSVLVGCGGAAGTAPGTRATGRAGAPVTLLADPFQEIQQVAHQIFEEMTGPDFESVFQIVAGQRDRSPKYTFLNEAASTADPRTRLFRAGTYAISTRVPTVTITLLDSPAAARNPGQIAEATRAAKAYVEAEYGHPVTRMVVDEQGPGKTKFSFLAISDDQPDRPGSRTVWTWYYVGTYAVSTKTAAVAFAVGSGENGPGTYTIDRPAR